jgi:glycosyltransferase involved in cell wall biosynthesis
MASRGTAVDLLRVQGHGPVLDPVPDGVRVIDLGSRHVYGCLLPLARYLRRERPHALLADKDRVNRTALLARWLAGVPLRLVLRSGTTISVDLASRGVVDRWLQRNSMRFLYRHADAVVVPSRGAAHDLATFAALPLDHIRVVANPVVTPDLAEWAAKPPPHPWFDEQVPVVLGVGELSERKDFATLVRAFARLRRDRRCRLVILGDGRRRDELLGLAGRLGISDDFALPGFVPNPYAAMARAAAFALTSRWEGLGIVLVEALALGTPSVACDCPSGPREVLADGAYGPLVPVGDDAALASALARLLDDPPARELVQLAARPYHVDESARAYLEVLGLEAGA